MFNTGFNNGLNTVRSGSGPLIVCLHGIGGSARSFDWQHAGLAGDVEVVSYDAPGYGHSPDPPADPGTAGYLDAVEEVITFCGRESAYVLGMSFGGVVAMRLALERPQLVAGLILGDSTRGSGQRPEQAEVMRRRPEELNEIGHNEFARRRAAQLLSPAAGDEERERVALAMARAIRLPGYAYAARFMAATDLTDSLASITTPTLVLYGEEDVITGHAESEAIAAGIGHATLKSIAGAGHLANQEQPDTFNSHVRDFITHTEEPT